MKYTENPIETDHDIINDDDVGQVEETVETKAKVEAKAVEEKKEIVTPEADFSISMKQEKLVAYLSAIASVNNEMGLAVAKDGLTVRQMDASHVYMVEGIIPAKTFSAYKVNTEGKITANLDTIRKIAKRADKDDIVNLSIDGGRLKVSIPNRNFRLGTFENEAEVPVPKLTLKTKVKLPVDSLKKALDDVALAEEDVVRIETRNNEVRFIAKGVYVDADVGLLKNNTLNLYVEGEESSLYSLEILKAIVDGSKNVADDVTLEFDRNMPISLSFDTLRFLLAPRVE